LWDTKTQDPIQTLCIGETIWKLSFSSIGSYLETDHGILEFETGTYREMKWKTENILWLPPDYRVMDMAVRHNIFVIGCSSGRVIFIELDADAIPIPPVL
ncbi:hypothetical protein BDD12DRAFT_825258, partial [Trichophaea hybrida]